VFEDDDWYSADHAATCLQRIGEGHDVVYSRNWFRYHVPLRRWSVKSKPVPGEGRVGLAPRAVQFYRRSLLNRPLYPGTTDGRYDRLTSVGIKGAGHGLPGRGGATDLHWLSWGEQDPGLVKLRALLGADADDYLRLVT
jgi:hypothetical protein